MKVKCINMKVKCINNDCKDMVCPLILGEVYEVEHKTDYDYLLKGESLSWDQRRFVVVDQLDPNEECPCRVGIMRHQCDYHRA